MSAGLSRVLHGSRSLRPFIRVQSTREIGERSAEQRPVRPVPYPAPNCDSDDRGGKRKRSGAGR